MNPIAKPVSSMDFGALTAMRGRAQQKDAGITEDVAKQFESIFIQMMLKSMRQANAVFEKDSMFSSSAMTSYRDMFDQEVASQMSAGQGVGLAEVMVRQLNKIEGVAPETLSKTPINDNL